jgi:hypothetical protein
MKKFVGIGSAVLVVMGLITGPAYADYTGSLSTTGARLTYKVYRLSGDAAHIGATVCDTVADGYSAYAKISVDVPIAIDPAASKTVSGSGNCSGFGVETYNVSLGISIPDRFKQIKLQLCRKSSSGALIGCVYRNLTTATF